MSSATNAALPTLRKSRFLEIDGDGVPLDKRITNSIFTYSGNGNEILQLPNADILEIASTLPDGPLVLTVNGLEGYRNNINKTISISVLRTTVNNITVDVAPKDLFVSCVNGSSTDYTFSPKDPFDFKLFFFENGAFIGLRSQDGAGAGPVVPVEDITGGMQDQIIRWDAGEAGFFSEITTSNIPNEGITLPKIEPGAANQILSTNGMLEVEWADNDILTSQIDSSGSSSGEVLTADGIGGAFFTSPVSSFPPGTNGQTILFVGTTPTSVNEILSSNIPNLGVTNAKLGTNSVTTTKILDEAVTEDKIGSTGASNNDVLTANGIGGVSWAPPNTGGSVPAGTNNQIVTYSGTTPVSRDFLVQSNIPTGSIDTSRLVDLNVTDDKIAANAVTSVKIADNAVITSKIADEDVTTAKLEDFAVTTDKLAASSVISNRIADNAVITTKINNSAVTSAKLGGSSVTTAKIANNNVTTPKIQDLAVTSSKLSNNAVQTSNISANAVDTTKIAAGGDGEFLQSNLGSALWGPVGASATSHILVRDSNSLDIITTKAILDFPGSVLNTNTGVVYNSGTAVYDFTVSGVYRLICNFVSSRQSGAQNTQTLSIESDPPGTVYYERNTLSLNGLDLTSGIIAYLTIVAPSSIAVYLDPLSGQVNLPAQNRCLSIERLS